MPALIFAFLMTLVSLGAVVLIVVLGIQAEGRKAKVRQETFLKLLESGVYDYRLVRRKKRGNGLLGWGIVFTALGLGIWVGLGSMEDPSIVRNGMTGAMIPFFVGIGMIVFWAIVRRVTKGSEENDKPVVLDERRGAPRPPTDVD